MTAAEYHRIVAQARHDFDMAQYIDSTARMQREQAEALARIRNTWITAAGPLPGMKYEGDETRWRPVTEGR